MSTVFFFISKDVIFRHTYVYLVRSWSWNGVIFVSQSLTIHLMSFHHYKKKVLVVSSSKKDYSSILVNL